MTAAQRIATVHAFPGTHEDMAQRLEALARAAREGEFLWVAVVSCTESGAVKTSVAGEWGWLEVVGALGCAQADAVHALWEGDE